MALLYLYPMVRKDGFICNNIFNVASVGDISPGIYLINGEKFFITTEISYRTSDQKYIYKIAFKLDNIEEGSII